MIYQTNQEEHILVKAEQWIVMVCDASVIIITRSPAVDSSETGWTVSLFVKLELQGMTVTEDAEM